MQGQPIPTYLLIENERAAYGARYHNLVPEGNELRAIILQAYGGVCVCCGCEDVDQLTLDHIEPVRGGTRRKFLALWRAGFPKDNLQVMCAPCNTAKGRASLALML
jgi:hypothetical protein